MGFVLGFALNHGTICTVIATSELVSEKRPARFIALLECALWAALAYAIVDVAPTMRQGWSPLAHLVPAAILFGIGAYVNGACVFGSVAHFGNGDVAYLCALVAASAVSHVEALFDVVPNRPAASAALSHGPELVGIALLAVVALRFIVSMGSEPNFRRLTFAMGAIGICFTMLTVLHPEYSIVASVRTIASRPAETAVISFCLLGGSLASGTHKHRRFMLKWPTAESVARRTLGGFLMGLGALLIPGSNDTVLLTGFPMGAWQAALVYLLLVTTLVALMLKFGSLAQSSIEASKPTTA